MVKALELLQREVSKFKTSAVLRMISDITWEGPEAFGIREPESSLLKYRQFELSLICKHAILFSDESTLKKSTASFNDIGKLLDTLSNRSEPQLEIEKNLHGKYSRETIYSFIRRSVQSQARYIGDFQSELARTLTIYNDLLKCKPRTSGINYEVAFNEIYGRNLERFLQICYLIHASYWGGYRRISDVVGFCSNLPKFSEEEFSKTFQTLSLKRTTFIEMTKRREIKDSAYEYYNFNPIQSHPIYSLNDEEFIIPSFYEYAFRLSDGIYFDLFNKYSDKNNIKANPFSEDLGCVFEEYVDILRGITGKMWTREFEYSGGKKFSDFSILENDNLFLIELKVKKLRLPTRIRSQEEDLAKDLEEGVVEGIIQIQNKINDVKNRVTGLEKYYRAKRFYGIVLIMDRLYTGNSQGYRELVDKILYKKKITLEFEYQIIEISELEYLIEPFRQGMSWTQLMERKIQPDVREYRFPSTSENQFLKCRFEMFIKTIENAISNIVSPGGQSVLHLPPFDRK